MISLSQLQTQKTETECLKWILEELADLGFNSTSWHDGDVQYTLVRIFAKIWSEMTGLVAALVVLAFNETSEGDALTAFSKSVFANTRYEATRVEGQLTYTDDGNTGPHTITVEAYLYEETESGNGYKYRNITGGVVPLGGSLPVTIRAEVAGAARNVGLDKITKQLAPIAGVTVTNDAIAGSTTWISSEGTDEETDASLRSRNRDKWATLSYAAPWQAYAYWARSASSNIARVVVDDSNPDGPGTLDVYIAGAAGQSSAQDQIDAQTLITSKQPETAVATVKIAAEQTQAFSATIYVDAEHFDGGVIKTSKKDEIEDAHKAYVNGLDITGTVLPPPDGDDVTGYFVFSEWVEAVTGIDGVVGIGSPSPSANVAITAWKIMTVLSTTFTYVAYTAP